MSVMDLEIWYNLVIKTFYERLVGRGKSKKLALTACVRKILVILNAMTIYHLVPRDSHFLLSLIKGCACFGLT